MEELQTVLRCNEVHAIWRFEQHQAQLDKNRLARERAEKAAETRRQNARKRKQPLSPTLSDEEYEYYGLC